MRISDICLKTGMTKDTVRYYEELGFLSDLKRSTNGYKNYTQAHVEQLILLKRVKELGFTLKEIKHLSDLFFARRLDERTMRDLLKVKEAEITETILDLQNTQREIRKTLSGECAHSEQLIKVIREKQ